jgi:hypothetical protein
MVGALCLLAPWAARNYYRFGHGKLTTTHGGFTLLLANNPSFYRYLDTADWGAVWSSEQLDRAWQNRRFAPDVNDPRWSDLSVRPTLESAKSSKARFTNEFEDDQFAYALARRFIAEHPRTFVQAALVRVSRLWSPLPHRVGEQESTARRAARYAVGLWYAVILTLACGGLWRLGGRTLHPPWQAGVLLCLAFTAVHALYWTDMRMRTPLMPFVYLAAASALGPRITRMTIPSVISV